MYTFERKYNKSRIIIYTLYDVQTIIVWSTHIDIANFRYLFLFYSLCPRTKTFEFWTDFRLLLARIVLIIIIFVFFWNFTKVHRNLDESVHPRGVQNEFREYSPGIYNLINDHTVASINLYGPF